MQTTPHTRRLIPLLIADSFFFIIIIVVHKRTYFAQHLDEGIPHPRSDRCASTILTDRIEIFFLLSNKNTFVHTALLPPPLLILPANASLFCHHDPCVSEHHLRLPHLTRHLKIISETEAFLTQLLINRVLN